MQYYQIDNDETGRYLLRTLRDAAQRGVRVRLLMDDLYTAGEDALLLALAATPNVELRLFNPFPAGRSSLLTPLLGVLLDFNRVHRRMHNKLFIADGAMAAVVGGRNIGNQYFTRSAGANFVDLDTFVIGALLPRLALPVRPVLEQPRVSAARDRAERQVRRRAASRVRAGDFGRSRRAGDRDRAAQRRGRRDGAHRGAPAYNGTPPPEPPPPNDVLGYSPIVNELDAGRLGPDLGPRRGLCRLARPVVGKTVQLRRRAAARRRQRALQRARADAARARSEVTHHLALPGARARAGWRPMREVSTRGVKISW